MSYRQRLILLSLLDAITVAVAILFMFVFRYDLTLFSSERVTVLTYVAAVHVVLNVVCLYMFNVYNRVWQFASTGEILALFKATLAAEAGFLLIHLFAVRWFPAITVPPVIYFSWVFIFMAIVGVRLTWRMFRTYTFKSSRSAHRNVLIVGAGQAGVLVAKEMKQDRSLEMRPVAFIDDNPHIHGLHVLDIPVIGGREEIRAAVERYNVKHIVIAIPSAPQKEFSDILNRCRQTGVNVKTLPRLVDLINGKVSVNMIRDVQLEDLLGREPVEVDLTEIAGYVKNRVILVTGAGGSIGSELCRQLAKFFPQKLLLLGHGENSIYEIESELNRDFPEVNVEPIIANIQDRGRMDHLFAAYRPHVVFHAAAHKHVPLMEKNPVEAIKNNVLGTKHVAECADTYGAERFVLISSDKAVNPTSVMGATKRLAEKIVLAMDRQSQTRFVTVRFGNVLGSRGSVVPLFKRQIQEGKAVTVTHPEMVRYFMTIPEAVQLVMQAGAFAKGGEVFILDMGKPVKIVDLARDMIRLSGLEPDRDIPIVFTGIRPGEKLFEELLTDEEGLSVTKHDRIFVSRGERIERNTLQFIVQKLEQLVQNDQPPVSALEIKRLIKTVVPAYQGFTEEHQTQASLIQARKVL